MIPRGARSPDGPDAEPVVPSWGPDGEPRDALAVLDALPAPASMPAPEAIARAELLSAIARANAELAGTVRLEEPAVSSAPELSYRASAPAEPPSSVVPRLVVRARGGPSGWLEVALVLFVTCVLPWPLLWMTRWSEALVPLVIQVCALAAMLTWSVRGTPFELVVEGTEARLSMDHLWGRRTRVHRGLGHAFVRQYAKDAPACVVHTSAGEVELVRATRPRSLVRALPDVLEWYGVWLRERAAAAASRPH